MATTAAESSGQQSERKQRKQTTLDSDVTMPQVTQPGDAPYDTTDPSERASSVEPDKSHAAKAGYGVVNAVVPLPARQAAQRDTKHDRTETYEATGPDGNPVKVTRNIETGESKAGS